MKKILFTLGLLGIVLFGGIKVMAQTTEPGANLPLLPDDSSSATATATYSAYSAYTTDGITTASDSATAVTSSQSAVDDAETGSEVVFLSILSLTGGIGLFLIKKFFDFRRYSI